MKLFMIWFIITVISAIFIDDTKVIVREVDTDGRVYLTTADGSYGISTYTDQEWVIGDTLCLHGTRVVPCD